MVSRKTTIVNEEGFHMRAAADFVKAVSEYQSDITVASAEKSAAARHKVNIRVFCGITELFGREFVEACNENYLELEALCSVYGHKADGVFSGCDVGVCVEGGVC